MANGITFTSHDTIRRLSQAIVDTGAPDKVYWRTGVISTIVGDGKVTLASGGPSQPALCMSHYEPAVGDNVAVLVVGLIRVVVGRFGAPRTRAVATSGNSGASGAWATIASISLTPGSWTIAARAWGATGIQTRLADSPFSAYVNVTYAGPGAIPGDGMWNNYDVPAGATRTILLQASSSGAAAAVQAALSARRNGG